MSRQFIEIENRMTKKHEKVLKFTSNEVEMKWKHTLFHTHQIGIKLKIWNYPALVRIWNKDFTCTAGGIKSLTNTGRAIILHYLIFGNCALSTVLIWNSSSRYHPQRITHVKKTWIRIFTSVIICNSKKLEKTSCPLMEEWIKKFCVFVQWDTT